VSWDETTRAKPTPVDLAKLEARRDQAYLIVLAGSSLGEMFKVDRERTIIGRGPKADVRMIDEGVSREHCEVLLEGDKLILHDLGSTNGTYCRGRRVERHELADGDKILVGTSTVLKFTYHDKLDEVFQRQMFESALRDDLTKVFNRKYFLDRVESEYAYALRHNVPLALVTFELDQWKTTVETLGRVAGDALLVDVATRLQTAVRVEDVFARSGTEQFALICRGADLLQGKIVGERLRYAIEKQAFAVEGKPVSLTISVGVAAVPNSTIRAPMELCAATEEMIDDARTAGGNRVCLWAR
jgi:diguanylate cyclase (GGDEF)-like protein